MTAFLVPVDGSGRIVFFDVVESEFHESVSEVTDHPVEVGVNVSDHVRPLPDRFSMTGFITNTPIVVNPFTQRGELTSIPLEVPTWTPPLEPTPGSLFRNAIGAIDGLLFGAPERVATVLTFPGIFNAVWETYELLRELQSNAVLMSIVTPIRLYENMLLERVGAPREAGNAGVSFGLEVRSLRIVASGQVEAAPVPADNVPGGVPLDNKGGQGATTPGDGEDPKSTGSIAFEKAKAYGLI